MIKLFIILFIYLVDISTIVFYYSKKLKTVYSDYRLHIDSNSKMTTDKLKNNKEITLQDVYANYICRGNYKECIINIHRKTLFTILYSLIAIGFIIVPLIIYVI